ncbi:MAG TPA: glycosyltransferase [bacterium]
MTPVHWLWSLALGMELLGWLAVAVCGLLTRRHMPTLKAPLQAAPPAAPAGRPWPLLSVIVPARNEAPHVERALRSLLAQDYPALEVVALDDRSDDDTGAILERLAAEAPRLTVLHVERLPPGWLGKNHANHLGAARARGELLLFTDADVVFEPGALRAAAAFLLRHGLGHLVAAPRLVAPGYWERAFQATFALYFMLLLQPWALRRPGSRAYAGMGAFNLVRRADYERVGGHTRLALEVVDDLKLGLLLRRHGVPQALAGGRELLSVRWQAGFWASLRGLLKNAFAGAEFRWLYSLGSVGLVLALGCLPLAGVLWAPGWPLRVLALAGMALPAVLLGVAARHSAGGTGLEGLVSPLTHLAFAGVMLLSALLATLRGGLTWRGTFYPLAALRQGVVRERDYSPRNAVGW